MPKSSIIENIIDNNNLNYLGEYYKTPLLDIITSAHPITINNKIYNFEIYLLDNLTNYYRFYYINTDGSIEEKPLDQCKYFVLNQLANIRWSKENKGIIYSSANALFQTDSSSRVNYLGVLEKVKTNPNYSTVWKAREPDNSASKFVIINANDIIAIYQSGIQYISDCFANEETLNISINTANTLNNLISIDLESGWPSNIY